MARMKFEMWPYRDKPDSEANGYMSRFTDGKGNYTDSWWCSPPESIDHVGLGYLTQRHRHPNVRNDRHAELVKSRFKEEMEARSKPKELMNMKFKLKAILRNYSEPVEVTSIDFKKGTFTWDYRGHLENVEDINDAEIIFENIGTTESA